MHYVRADDLRLRRREYIHVSATNTKTDLCAIPGVGPNMKQHILRLGYHWVEDLKQANPEEMYQQDCILHGGQLDRCVLYVYRLAVYFATTPNPEPQKLKWWYWKE